MGKEKKESEGKMNPCSYEVGSKILIKAQRRSNLLERTTASLQPIYEGPYIIIRFLTPNSILVEKVDNPGKYRRTHIWLTKRFIERIDESNVQKDSEEPTNGPN